MKKSNRTGLTLVELLVSLTIFAVILTITFSILFKIQSVQQKINNKYDVNREVKEVTGKITHQIKSLKHLPYAGPERLSFLNENGDTTVYYLRNDTLWANNHTLTYLMIDTLGFEYFKNDREEALDFYTADKNLNGCLDGIELDSITGITVNLVFYIRNRTDDYKIRKEIFVGFRNTQRL
jgi:prepilin-type N-terminal cleavage/methylation domain-containing protein